MCLGFNFNERWGKGFPHATPHPRALPQPHLHPCWSPKEALSLPDRQGINLEADTDQLWQSSTSTSALSAQQARCPPRLSGHRDGASDGRSGTCRSSKCERARARVRAPGPRLSNVQQRSPKTRVLHAALFTCRTAAAPEQKEQPMVKASDANY